METTKLSKKKFIIFDDVFPNEINTQIYEAAAQKPGRFSESKIRITNPQYIGWRKSMVMYHWDFSAINAQIIELVQGKFKEVISELAVADFEPAQYEVQMTTHNHGDYYKKHKDNGSTDTASRVLTFVYYFNAIPKLFSGGELVLYPKNREPIIVEPINNRLIFFKSSIRHEVKPVVCPEQEFKNGRFTLNGWIRKDDSQPK